MPGRGDAQFTVALQGFSEFERGGLTSFFRLASSRRPAYVQVAGLRDSDFIIADADDATALHGALALGRPEDTVYVGCLSPLGAMHWLPRPIEPTRIVRALDGIVERRQSPALSLAALARQQQQTTSSPATARPPERGPRRVPTLTLGAAVEPGALGMPAQASSEVPSIAGFVDDEASGPDVLVADDSRIARRFLQMRLQKLGYRVHLASDGDEALEQLTQQRFALVFLDVKLGSAESLDGLAICQHIKQHPDFGGDEAPKVLMVTGLAGATDRVRGSLAGCDAYLTKPLTEPDLLRALESLGRAPASR